MAAVVETRDDEIERLQRLIKQLQRTQFGRRSERLDADQLALGLEDLDADVARAEADLPAQSKNSCSFLIVVFEQGSRPFPESDGHVT